MDKVLNVQEVHQRSYDIIFFNHRFGYEFILLALAFITAYAAVRSFKASRRLNELATVPHLYFETKGEFPKQTLMLVKDNDRLAFDIEIDTLYVMYKSENVTDWLIDKFQFKIDEESSKSNFMTSKNNELPLSIYKNGEILKGEETNYASWLVSERFIVKDGFWILFKDSQNQRYFTTIRFKDGVTHILKAPAKYTLLPKIHRKYRDFYWFMVRFWFRLRIAYSKFSKLG